MPRGYVTIDLTTNEIRYVPPWPPLPTKGDLWEKEGMRKRLVRQVIKVDAGRVLYKNEDGLVKTCHKDAFWYWCRGAKLLKHKNKKVVYKETPCTRSC